MPTLFCENGKHEWTRESRRGRLPKNCPEHQPEKDIKITSGAKSHVAPYETRETSQEIIKNSDIRNTLDTELESMTTDLLSQLKAATEKPITRELHCEAGNHTWQAPRQRGRAPRNCPEHAVSAQKPAQRESNTKSQATLLAAILEKPGAAQCGCGIEPTTSPAQLRAMGGGCRDPHHVCNVLDACRRAVGI